GSGPYAVSMGHIWTNMVFYASLSFGAIIIVATFALTAFVSSLASVRRPFLRQTAVGSLLVLVSALALILPYLLLSRSFDYYGPNFMPFIVFSIGPAVAALRTTRGRSLPISRAISVAVAALLSVVVFRANSIQHGYHFRWAQHGST